MSGRTPFPGSALHRHPQCAPTEHAQFPLSGLTQQSHPPNRLQQRSSIYFRQICTIACNNWFGKLRQIQVEIPTDGGSATGEPDLPPPNLIYDMWIGPCPEMPYIECRVHPQCDYSRPGWLQIAQFCPGNITGWGCRMYDIAQWGMGEDMISVPIEVKATGEFPDRGHLNVHDGFKGEAIYAKGVRMISKNGNPRVRFNAEDGWACRNRDIMNCSDQELLRRKPSDKEISLHHSSNHMNDFLRAVRTGKDPACPVEEGHRTNTSCVLHHLSMKLGERNIKWDPLVEKVAGDPEVESRILMPMRKPYTLRGNPDNASGIKI